MSLLMEKMKFELNDIVSFVDNSKTYVGRIVIRDFGNKRNVDEKY